MIGISNFILICTEEDCGRKAPIEEFIHVGRKLTCPYCRGFKFIVIDDDIPVSDPYDGLSQEEIDECEALIEESRSDYKRLQHLFWQEVDDVQRKKILVEHNIIPEIDEELTQSLERHALEAAKKVCKLGLIWDSIMALLPEDKQESNPYKESAE